TAMAEQIENAAYVGMCHLFCQVDLASKPFRGVSVAMQDVRPNHLYSDSFLQLQIFRFIYFAHSSFRDKADYSESFGENVSCLTHLGTNGSPEDSDGRERAVKEIPEVRLGS